MAQSHYHPNHRQTMPGFRIEGEWQVPGGTWQSGILEQSDGWILTIGEGWPRRDALDLGESEDDEVLPVLLGRRADGTSYTLVGAMRVSPGPLTPSRWAIVAVWQGMASHDPERELVQAIRVSGASVSNWIADALGAEGLPLQASVIDATIYMPESRSMPGWTRIEFRVPKPLDEAENEAWKIAHLEAVLCGGRVGVPLVEAILQDGRRIAKLDDRAGLRGVLLTPANFAAGFAKSIEAWWRLNDAMPLVVERWITALDPQPVLSQAYLMATSLQPLHDALHATQADDAEWEERKQRILATLDTEDAGFVASRLRQRPAPAIREKVLTLLRPAAEPLSFSEEDLRTWAGNFEDLRNELVHRLRPKYDTTTRYLELQMAANLGVSLIMYHLWLAIGADRVAAQEALQQYWSKWQIWVRPSASQEPLAPRRGPG